MSSIVQKLTKKGLAVPPDEIVSNSMYEVITGSVSYGVSSDTSDMDVVGFYMPRLDIMFPHLKGEIAGFGKESHWKPTKPWQKHHIKDESDGKEYDLTMYSITRFFQLAMENNPNMIDYLFVPYNCILHNTQVGQMIREKRHIFLHRGCFHKFAGYAHAQLKKLKDKKRTKESKRHVIIEEHGYDTKFSYHLYRLLDEVEQILTTGDLNLQRGKEVMKEIRRGEWEMERFEIYFSEREKYLQKVYDECTILPYGPREDEIKQLLLDCLEHHYGSLEKVVQVPDKMENALRQIAEITNKVLG